MLIWFIFGLGVSFGTFNVQNSLVYSNLLLFILFVLLGWKCFGAPAKPD